MHSHSYYGQNLLTIYPKKITRLNFCNFRGKRFSLLSYPLHGVKSSLEKTKTAKIQVLSSGTRSSGLLCDLYSQSYNSLNYRQFFIVIGSLMPSVVLLIALPEVTDRGVYILRYQARRTSVSMETEHLLSTLTLTLYTYSALLLWHAAHTYAHSNNINQSLQRTLANKASNTSDTEIRTYIYNQRSRILKKQAISFFVNWSCPICVIQTFVASMSDQEGHFHLRDYSLIIQTIVTRSDRLVTSCDSARTAETIGRRYTIAVVRRNGSLYEYRDTKEMIQTCVTHNQISCPYSRYPTIERDDSTNEAKESIAKIREEKLFIRIAIINVFLVDPSRNDSCNDNLAKWHIYFHCCVYTGAALDYLIKRYSKVTREKRRNKLEERAYLQILCCTKHDSIFAVSKAVFELIVRLSSREVRINYYRKRGFTKELTLHTYIAYTPLDEEHPQHSSEYSESITQSQQQNCDNAHYITWMNISNLSVGKEPESGVVFAVPTGAHTYALNVPRPTRERNMSKDRWWVYILDQQRAIYDDNRAQSAGLLHPFEFSRGYVIKDHRGMLLRTDSRATFLLMEMTNQDHFDINILPRMQASKASLIQAFPYLHARCKHISKKIKSPLLLRTTCRQCSAANTDEFFWPAAGTDRAEPKSHENNQLLYFAEFKRDIEIEKLKTLLKA
ncbi:hypothetical protein WN51_09176 [Melipona quadrifasciata]|uniref:Uncharacterized protein n=1 Tax=Melipona quadrifasciata TaxID=166423 RepID=A0A0M8ZMP0_9HYME|nr:hypothetical protein WN51_09176 [Melipona quadrifasciata]